MKNRVRGLIQLVSRRHVALVPANLLFQRFPKLVKDPQVGQYVFDLLVEWTKYVEGMPEGTDRTCQQEMLRYSKGMLKAWRLWAVRKEMEKAKRPEKQRQLKRRLATLRTTPFSSERKEITQGITTLKKGVHLSR